MEKNSDLSLQHHGQRRTEFNTSRVSTQFFTYGV